MLFTAGIIAGIWLTAFRVQALTSHEGSDIKGLVGNTADNGIQIARDVVLDNKSVDGDLVIVAQNIKLTNIKVTGNVFIAGSEVIIKNLRAFSLHIVAGNVNIQNINLINAAYFLTGYLEIKHAYVNKRLLYGAGVARLENINTNDIKAWAGNLKMSGKASSVVIVINKNSTYNVEGLVTQKLKVREYTPKLTLNFSKRNKGLSKRLAFWKNFIILAFSTFIFAELIYRWLKPFWHKLFETKRSRAISSTLIGAGLTLVLIMFAALAFVLQHYLHLYFAWMSFMFIGLLMVAYSVVPFLLVVVLAVKLHYFICNQVKNKKIKNIPVDFYILGAALFLVLLYLGPLWTKLIYSALLFDALGEVTYFLLHKFYATLK